MNKCPMCGKGIFTEYVVTYVTDSGDKFTANVCTKCHKTAQRVIAKENK